MNHGEALVFNIIFLRQLCAENKIYLFFKSFLVTTLPISKLSIDYRKSKSIAR